MSGRFHISIPTCFIDIRDWLQKALNFFCHAPKQHTYWNSLLPCGQKRNKFLKIFWSTLMATEHVSIPTRFIDIRDWSRKALNFFCHLWYILWELGGNLFLFLRARQRKRFPGNGNSFNRVHSTFEFQIVHQNCLSISPQKIWAGTKVFWTGPNLNF